jgi:SAM-dependent methyltransferase
MQLDYEVFEQALTLFHRHSLQNSEAVRQLQDKGVLPVMYRTGFSILDIGAGQGHLPDLMRPYAEKLMVLEPNPRCCDVLAKKFTDVYACPWDASARYRVSTDHPQGFDLITLSHVLYHFNGLNDIRDKIRLALTLLKPGGHLAIILNQPSAPMALIGIGFQRAAGRRDEAATNLDLHACCHESRFYQALAGRQAEVTIYTIDTPLDRVPSREDLIVLFRMCLLNPLSAAPCDTIRLDAFISDCLDATYPALTYPATIPSQDDLVIIRK